MYVCMFLGHQRRPYIVFRNRFLYIWLHVRVCVFIYNIIYVYMYVCMYVCMYISVKMVALWGSSTLLNFHSLCLHLRSHLPNGKYFRIRCRNTKPTQSLRRTFSKKQPEKKTSPITNWPLWRLLFTRLEIVLATISSFTKRTKVVPEVFQEGECCLEGLINLAGHSSKCYRG